MTTFCKTLCETPDNWGETAYIPSEKIEKFVVQLNRELEWNVSIDETHDWRFVKKMSGGCALYKLGGVRHDEYALFTKNQNRYDMAHRPFPLSRGTNWAQFSNPPHGVTARRDYMSEAEAIQMAAEWLDVD
jgi:hypothetical protein